ncbi:MAG: hypothetical protein EOM54_00400 [Clostridia bacterium]|nr:hypothetical protein [Clostridia bacterium]
MKKKFSVTVALLLAFIFGLSSLSVLADDGSGLITSSEEVIYAALTPGGDPHDVYSVIILNVEKAGSVSYYGDFTGVRNLTDTGEVSYVNGRLTADADTGRFYCQGNLADTDLPWNVDIVYTLDGAKIDPGELAGTEGALNISIRTTKNESVDARFFDNYLMQITVTLDTDLCENIVAADATLANSGADKLVTFTVLPGSEGDMTLSADVRDFEMSGITISAVPYSANGALGEDISELTDGLSDLADAVSQLTDGAAELKDGAIDLSVGAAELKKGAASYGDGIAQAAGGGGDLISASEEIKAALAQISAGLSGQSGGADLSALTQLPAGLAQLADALDDIAAGMSDLEEGFSAANAAMATAVGAIPAPSLSETEIGALMAANPNSEELEELIENYKAAQTVRATWAQVSPAFDAVSATLPTLGASVTTVSASLRGMASQIEAAMQSSDSLSGLAALYEGMAALSENYSAFHEGLVSYAGGVNALYEGWTGLEGGISAISSGAYLLSKGAKEFSDGMETLNGETSGIPEEMEAITGALSSDFEPASFISELNDGAASVQFVIKTDAIEKPEPDETGTAAASPSTLWDRIKALFSAG